jgi:hypothetical protein
MRKLTEDEKKAIEGMVEWLMLDFGPDKHIDGSDKISEFIVSLIEGTGEEYVTNLYEDNSFETLSYETFNFSIFNFLKN